MQRPEGEFTRVNMINISCAHMGFVSLHYFLPSYIIFLWLFPNAHSVSDSPSPNEQRGAADIAL